MNNSCFEFCKKYGFNYLIPMNVSFSDPFNPLKSNKRPYKNFSWKDISKTIDLNSDRANEFVDCNVFGLLTEPNKLVVIDCDVDKDLYSDKEHTSLNQKYGEQIGFNNLVLFLMERLNKSYSEIIPLIDTLTVITHTEGIHLYYRLTEEQKEPIQSNADKLTHKVDIRAKGGLIMCPCSRLWNPYLKEFREYKPNKKSFLSNPQSLKYLPYEIYDLLPKVTENKTVIKRDYKLEELNREYNSKADHYLKKILSGFSKAGEGNRNQTLSKLSGQAFRLCPHYFSVADIESLCIKAGSYIGLKQSEYIPTIMSAKKYGLNNPKYLK